MKKYLLFLALIIIFLMPMKSAGAGDVGQDMINKCIAFVKLKDPIMGDEFDAYLQQDGIKEFGTNKQIFEFEKCMHETCVKKCVEAGFTPQQCQNCSY